MTTYTITINELDDEPMLDAAGMALMFGVTASDVKALEFFNGVTRIPDEWVRQGRRRTREAAAHTGSRGLLHE